MNMCEALQTLKDSNDIWVTPQAVAPVLGCDPNVLRRQAQADQSKLGFSVSVIGTRVKIPLKPFLRWLGELEG